MFQVFTTTLSGTSNMDKLNNLLYQPLKFTSEQTLNTKFLYLDISKPDKFTIPGIPFPIPGLFLILATVAQFLSVKITAPYLTAEEKIARKTKGQADDMQVAMHSSMTYTLPLMTLIFGLSFPSGLALYWLVFSVISMFQQASTSGWGSLTPAVSKLTSLFRK
jgi:YidC/Oxa1 family membrane protein insertase